jgi:hypothetical protein
MSEVFVSILRSPRVCQSNRVATRDFQPEIDSGMKSPGGCRLSLLPRESTNAIRRKPPEIIAPYCFKPGQSGNPGRRPKKPLTELLKRQLAQIDPGDKLGRSYVQLLIASVVKRATKKSDILVKEIFDRIEGKVAIPEPGKAETGVRVILMDRIPRPDRSRFIAQRNEDSEE